MKTCTATLLMFIACQFVSAQQDTIKHVAKKSYWFDVGLGWGGQGSAFNLGLSYEIVPKRIISLHYSGVVTNHRCYDYVFFFPIADYPLGEDADAYEITYGVLKKGKAGIMNFSAGLSYVKIQSGGGDGPPIGFDFILTGSSRPVDYKLAKYNTVGLALRAQFIPSIRWGGFGISPYVNINRRYTFASISFQLALGRIKPKARKLNSNK
jgi:hypothetical protein